MERVKAWDMESVGIVLHRVIPRVNAHPRGSYMAASDPVMERHQFPRAKSSTKARAIGKEKEIGKVKVKVVVKEF